jgi:hypothetical protein
MNTPKRKYLAFYHNHELRVEQLDDPFWGSSCEIVPNLDWDDRTTYLTADSAKSGALIAAQNLLTQYRLLHEHEIEWRDLSNDSDEIWRDSMQRKNHPRYLHRDV